MKLEKISNSRVAYFVRHHRPFSTHTGSMYAQIVGDHYIVYSYGPHWPLAVWNGRYWMVNTEKYSRTTSFQSGICRTACINWIGCDTATIKSAAEKAYETLNRQPGMAD